MALLSTFIMALYQSLTKSLTLLPSMVCWRINASLPPCILRRNATAQTAAESKLVIWSRLKEWQRGKFDAMVHELRDLALQSSPGCARADEEFNVEAEGRNFNSMVLDGNINEAVNEVCERDWGGLYQPNDKCLKTNCPVIADILREKHPEPMVHVHEDAKKRTETRDQRPAQSTASRRLLPSAQAG